MVFIFFFNFLGYDELFTNYLAVLYFMYYCNACLGLKYCDADIL